MMAGNDQMMAGNDAMMAGDDAMMAANPHKAGAGDAMTGPQRAGYGTGQSLGLRERRSERSQSGEGIGNSLSRCDG
jgi:hypothetical protein